MTIPCFICGNPNPPPETTILSQLELQGDDARATPEAETPFLARMLLAEVYMKQALLAASLGMDRYPPEGSREVHRITLPPRTPTTVAHGERCTDSSAGTHPEADETATEINIDTDTDPETNTGTVHIDLEDVINSNDTTSAPRPLTSILPPSNSRPRLPLSRTPTSPDLPLPELTFDNQPVGPDHQPTLSKPVLRYKSPIPFASDSLVEVVLDDGGQEEMTIVKGTKGDHKNREDECQTKKVWKIGLRDRCESLWRSWIWC